LDECFTYNWEHARQTNLKIGAYHFFSFQSSGATQAQHFIDTVSYQSRTLYPVVDVELYGRYASKPASKEKVLASLTEYLTILEAYYKVKPIIYTTMKTYRLYFSDSFKDYPLWIRNVYFKPDFLIHRSWTLWQYSDHELLDGYSGSEPFIDLNVFSGDQNDLDRITLK